MKHWIRQHSCLDLFTREKRLPSMRSAPANGIDSLSGLAHWLQRTQMAAKFLPSFVNVHIGARWPAISVTAALQDGSQHQPCHQEGPQYTCRQRHVHGECHRRANILDIARRTLQPQLDHMHCCTGCSHSSCGAYGMLPQVVPA